MRKNQVISEDGVFEAAHVIAARGERPMAKQIVEEFFGGVRPWRPSF